MRKFAEPFLCETFGAAKEGDGVTALDDGGRGRAKVAEQHSVWLSLMQASYLFFYVLFLTRPLSHIITARQL